MKITIAVMLALMLPVLLPAQNKTLHVQDATKLKVKMGSNDGFFNDATCDTKGNIYVTIFDPRGTPSERPLLKFDSAGILQAQFESSRKDLGLSEYEDHNEPSALLPDGGVARLAWSKDTLYVTKFSSDGTFVSRMKLDSPAFLPYQFLVFPSGEMFAAGLEHSHSVRSISPYKRFTAIYDAKGHLLKRLVLPGDAEIEAAIEAGDSRYAMAPMSGNRAVTRGRARLGEDGNVYLMRGTSPPLFYVISSSGELVRTVKVEPPFSGQVPSEMQLVKGRIAVEFWLGCDAGGQCSGVNLEVADAVSGEGLARYDHDNFFGSLACYNSGPDLLTSLTLDNNQPQMTRWAAKQPVVIHP